MKEETIMVQTSASIYEVDYNVERRIPFRVRKIKTLEGKKSNTRLGKTFYGNTLVLTNFGLILSMNEEIILKTSYLIRVY